MTARFLELGKRAVALAARHGSAFARHATARKVANFLLAIHEQRAGHSRVRNRPFEIIVDPTNICPLRCPLCVTGQRLNKRPPGRMEYQIYEQVLRELGPYLFKIRFYSWGEPLLHPRLFDMIAAAQDHNIGTEVSSNLLPLEPGAAEEIVRSGLELLVVSLDGASAETYAHYRRGGDFDRVIENIRQVVEAKKRLRASRPVVETQFLVMRHNEHEMEAARRLGRSLGVERVRFAPVTINVRNPADRSWLPSRERLSRYRYEDLADKLYEARRRCPWPWRSAVINYDGTVSPCCVFEGPDTDLGSLRTHSFAEIWNGEAYQAARAALCGATSAEPRTICHHCRGKPRAKDPDQHGLY